MASKYATRTKLPYITTLTFAGCSKRRYATRADAKTAIKLLKITQGITQYCYKCHNCDDWHLTSQKQQKELK